MGGFLDNLYNEYLRLRPKDPGAPHPAQGGIRALPESGLAKGIRHASQWAADRMYTPGSNAAQQTEEALQEVMGILSPVDPGSGLPNMDIAPVPSAIKAARRRSLTELAQELKDRVRARQSGRTVIAEVGAKPNTDLRVSKVLKAPVPVEPDIIKDVQGAQPQRTGAVPKYEIVNPNAPDNIKRVYERDTEFHSTRMSSLADILEKGYLGRIEEGHIRPVSTKRQFTESRSVPSEVVLELRRTAPELYHNKRRPFVEQGWGKTKEINVPGLQTTVKKYLDDIVTSGASTLPETWDIPFDVDQLSKQLGSYQHAKAAKNYIDQYLQGKPIDKKLRDAYVEQRRSINYWTNKIQQHKEERDRLQGLIGDYASASNTKEVNDLISAEAASHGQMSYAQGMLEEESKQWKYALQDFQTTLKDNVLSAKNEFENRSDLKIPVNPNTLKSVYIRADQMVDPAILEYFNDQGISTYRYAHQAHKAVRLPKDPTGKVASRNILPVRVMRDYPQLQGSRTGTTGLVQPMKPKSPVELEIDKKFQKSYGDQVDALMAAKGQEHKDLADAFIKQHGAEDYKSIFGEGKYNSLYESEESVSTTDKILDQLGLGPGAEYNQLKKQILEAKDWDSAQVASNKFVDKFGFDEYKKTFGDEFMTSVYGPKTSEAVNMPMANDIEKITNASFDPELSKKLSDEFLAKYGPDAYIGAFGKTDYYSTYPEGPPKTFLPLSQLPEDEAIKYGKLVKEIQESAGTKQDMFLEQFIQTYGYDNATDTFGEHVIEDIGGDMYTPPHVKNPSLAPPSPPYKPKESGWWMKYLYGPDDKKK